MSTVLTIAKREVTSLFYSPIAYFVLFLFLVVTGFLFGLQVFVPGQLSEIRRFIDFSRFGLFFIIPGITMSVFADEYRSGRIEMLRTSPITEAQLVLGKYLGAAYFFLILVAVTLVFVGLLVIYGRPDWGMTAAAYVGLILLGLMFHQRTVHARAGIHSPAHGQCAAARPPVLHRGWPAHRGLCQGRGRFIASGVFRHVYPAVPVLHLSASGKPEMALIDVTIRQPCSGIRTILSGEQ
jgi:ABC-type transport system involved in cytochrome c biogenesis permease component